MGSGFSVEDLVLAGRRGSALRIGLTRLSANEWLWSQIDLTLRALAVPGAAGYVANWPNEMENAA